MISSGVGQVVRFFLQRIVGSSCRVGLWNCIKRFFLVFKQFLAFLFGRGGISILRAGSILRGFFPIPVGLVITPGGGALTSATQAGASSSPGLVPFLEESSPSSGLEIPSSGMWAVCWSRLGQVSLGARRGRTGALRSLVPRS